MSKRRSDRSGNALPSHGTDDSRSRALSPLPWAAPSNLMYRSRRPGAPVGAPLRCGPDCSGCASTTPRHHPSNRSAQSLVSALPPSTSLAPTGSPHRASARLAVNSRTTDMPAAPPDSSDRAARTPRLPSRSRATPRSSPGSAPRRSPPSTPDPLLPCAGDAPIDWPGDSTPHTSHAPHRSPPPPLPAAVSLAPQSLPADSRSLLPSPPFHSTSLLILPALLP